MANDMLASTRGRALRTGSIADLPVGLVLRIWRFVEVLVATRIQSIRRGLVVRRWNWYRQTQFTIKNQMIRLLGIHTDDDARFLGASLASERRLGLNRFWWRKYYRNVPTQEQHLMLMAPTTTNNNMMIQAELNPWMIANLQVGNSM